MNFSLLTCVVLHFGDCWVTVLHLATPFPLVCISHKEYLALPLVFVWGVTSGEGRDTVSSFFIVPLGLPLKGFPLLLLGFHTRDHHLTISFQIVVALSWRSCRFGGASMFLIAEGDIETRARPPGSWETSSDPAWEGLVPIMWWDFPFVASKQDLPVSLLLECSKGPSIKFYQIPSWPCCGCFIISLISRIGTTASFNVFPNTKTFFFFFSFYNGVLHEQSQVHPLRCFPTM